MKTILRVLLLVALMIGAMFGSAGRWDLPFAWACIGIYAVFVVLILLTIDPGLRKERLNPVVGGQDRNLRLVMLPFMLGCWVIAGLDVGRFHWSDRVPFEWRMAGLVGLVASLGISFWAMLTNRFFSPVVRIQQERGHHLITSGPYRYVRHPGYVGIMGAPLFGSLALGSLWAIVPALGVVFLILRRTVIEDKFLRRELAGYADYASRVRFRLLPGIW